MGNCIRDWRQSGGNQPARLGASHSVHSVLPSPTVSASRKKQKTSQSVNRPTIAGGISSFRTLLVVLCVELSSLDAS